MAEVKLYKLQVTGQELDERLNLVNANFEEIQRNFNEDAEFKAQVESNYAKKTDLPDLTNYALKSDITEALNDNATMTMVSDAIATKANANDVYTKDEIDNKGFITKLPEIPTVPTKVSAFENDANYLTEHQSLAGLATETYVNEEIAKVVGGAPETLDTLNEIATALNDNATMTMVSNAIATKANSADVYTKTEIDGKGFITELPTIPTVPTNVSAFENDANYLTEQSLDTYATKQYVDNAVTVASTGGQVDLTNYVTKDELNNASYITSNDVPKKVSDFENDAQYLTEQSLAGLATETYVSEQIANVVGGAPETLDTLKEIATALDDNATMTMVSTAIETKANKSEVTESFNTVNAALDNKVDSATLSNYALKTDIPNMTNYALKSDIPETQDLSVYATKAEIEAAAYLTSAVASNMYQPKGEYLTLATLPEIPSINGLATTEAVEAVNTKIDTVLANAPEELDTLKEIADLLATKQDATAVVNALATKANSADVYTKTEIDDKGYLTQTVADTLYQQTGNYLTEHQSLANYATLEYVNGKIAELRALIEQLQALHNTNNTDPEQEPTVTEKSIAPTLTYDDESLTVTATGEGTVVMYVNGVETVSPHTFTRGESEVTYTVTATAQQDDKEVSDTVKLECVVQAETPVVTPENTEQPTPENTEQPTPKD